VKTVVASSAGSFARCRWECMACVMSLEYPPSVHVLIGGFLPALCAGEWVAAYLLRLPQRGRPPINCRRLVRVIVIDGRGCNCFRPGGPMPHALDAFGTSKKALRSPCISAFMSVSKAWHTKIDFSPSPNIYTPPPTKTKIGFEAFERKYIYQDC
jgi:hypothetical protein